MAQQFSYRYPIVDGQGNWGSTDDPKSFAAMRYTESRLRAYADVLLSELGQGTVDWQPNFDGTLEEPKLLPARLPNVLLNGTQGIAVGMATDIPPHNLREVAAACIHLLDDPRRVAGRTLQARQGPDFPTGAEIVTPKSELRAMYKTRQRHASARARVFEMEDGEIVITALPYQVSGAKVLEQIAGADAREEAADGRGPARRVRPRAPDAPRDHAALESRRRRAADGAPVRDHRPRAQLPRQPQRHRARRPAARARTAGRCSTEWLGFRIDTVKRRLRYRLEKVTPRLHILDGLLIAYLNLDEVIRIVRREDEPKPVLMKRFKLSDAQAEAILETKLRHLAKLEEMKIRGEQEELAEEREALEKTLKSAAKLKKLVRDELVADAEKFGDERRTKIVEREAAQAIDETELVTSGAGHRRAVDARLGAAAQGPRHRPARAFLQDRRRVPGRGARPQHAAGGVPRLDRARLFAAGAHAAVGARAGRAAVGPARSAGRRDLCRAC